MEGDMAPGDIWLCLERPVHSSGGCYWHLVGMDGRNVAEYSPRHGVAPRQTPLRPLMLTVPRLKCAERGSENVSGLLESQMYIMEAARRPCISQLRDPVTSHHGRPVHSRLPFQAQCLLLLTEEPNRDLLNEWGKNKLEAWFKVFHWLH